MCPTTWAICKPDLPPPPAASYGEAMAEQSPAVTISHPPQAILNAVNPVLRFLLGTPLAGGARKEIMVVSFKGRKTGRQYSIPLSAHRIDGDLYAISSAPWKHNFRDGANAEVLLEGTKTTMRGELVKDPATVAELCHRCADGYGAKKAQRMLGMKFRDDRVPTLDEFREAVNRDKIAAVRLTPAQ
jgi:hypothetical protein